jgi:hypothetical protein
MLAKLAVLVKPPCQFSLFGLTKKERLARRITSDQKRNLGVFHRLFDGTDDRSAATAPIAPAQL